jgi:shikimate dehydrogenase
VIGPLMERELRTLTIANRTPMKARNLAAEFSDMGKIAGCSFAELQVPPYDLIINATSASLQGEMPEMPAGLVDEGTVCYDMAYGRGQTPFTTWALALHAHRTTRGWGMLVEQAAESFFLWRGVRPNTQPVLATLAQHA